MTKSELVVRLRNFVAVTRTVARLEALAVTEAVEQQRQARELIEAVLGELVPHEDLVAILS